MVESKNTYVSVRRTFFLPSLPPSLSPSFPFPKLSIATQVKSSGQPSLPPSLPPSFFLKKEASSGTFFRWL